MVFYWAHAGPTVPAAFLASLVECVEAMTVVLAVGAVRGWRGALAGSFAALVVLLVLVAVLGPAVARIPLDVMQAGVGTLLLLFGVRWLRKAILRAAGVIASRDEQTAYHKERQAMEQIGGNARSWDGVAIVTTFKITMIEGIEVVFIVIAMGTAGRGLLAPAGVGALAALLVVLLLGMLLRRPIASVPENLLKLVVGVLLTSFGTFWVGEGMGLSWPGSDWSVLALLTGYTAVMVTTIWSCHGFQDLADHPAPDGS